MNVKLQHTNTHATVGHVVYRHPHRNQSQHECQTTTHKHTCHSGPCSLSPCRVNDTPIAIRVNHECQTTTHKHTCHSGPCSLSTPPSQSDATHVVYDTPIAIRVNIQHNTTHRPRVAFVFVCCSLTSMLTLIAIRVSIDYMAQSGMRVCVL